MTRRALFVALAIAVVCAGCSGVSLPTPVDDRTATAGPGGGPGTATVLDDPGVPADGRTRQATVTRVVDGDTVEVSYANGTTDTVRLVGVDTPETHGDTDPAEFEGVPETAAGRSCLADAGERASAALARWVDGESVTLVEDPNEGPRDRYDRLLAYVVRNESALNYRIVAGGYGRVYDSEFTKAEPFYAAEAAAQRAGRGVWDCADPASRDATDGLSVRVVADAPGNDNENRNGEFVVLTNAGNESRAVGGWTVSDDGGHEYAFPANATLPADESVRLYTGDGTANATAYYWGADGAVWNNDGDTATVRDENGTVVVQRSY